MEYNFEKVTSNVFKLALFVIKGMAIIIIFNTVERKTTQG